MTLGHIWQFGFKSNLEADFWGNLTCG